MRVIKSQWQMLYKELYGLAKDSERLRCLFRSIGFFGYRYVKGIKRLLHRSFCSCCNWRNKLISETRFLFNIHQHGFRASPAQSMDSQKICSSVREKNAYGSRSFSALWQNTKFSYFLWGFIFFQTVPSPCNIYVADSYPALQRTWKYVAANLLVQFL